MATTKKPVETEEDVVEETEKKPVAKARIKKDGTKKEKLHVRMKNRIKENKKPIACFGGGFLGGLLTAVLGAVGYSKIQSRKAAKVYTAEESPMDTNL